MNKRQAKKAFRKRYGTALETILDCVPKMAEEIVKLIRATIEVLPEIVERMDKEVIRRVLEGETDADDRNQGEIPG
ncbi:MAG: hypothetical protein IJL43_00470 [Lachnospiraceae bacterium]|nr:hypothetical protein [Lachnospiraceae bacterium]